ncbi:MAG: [FeFe] hydrogenase H-cluster radical SAM maturase HydE [Spirochaetales bacterium]|nr:[FeFe] hydrogenase H-cluster radical SAM maturase HydE [Spirochaetales bacterium]
MLKGHVMIFSEQEVLDLYHRNPEELCRQAEVLCRNTYGNKVYLRGLIEFSNYCVMDCLYCGIRKSHSAVKRYRLDHEMIMAIVRKGYEAGLRTFVLQGGEDPWYDEAYLCRLLENIKSLTRDQCAITLSCGIRPRHEYRAMKQAGADRYLMRFETADPELHQYLRGGVTLKQRLQALDDLKASGFEIGSGFMTGLPDEKPDSLIKNVSLCKELELDMVGIGPFIPHKATPLAGAKQKPLSEALYAVAMVRLLLPLANIPATTAMGTLEPDGRERALECGANVLMPNITPAEFKKEYLLYPDKICLEESGFECIGCLSLRCRGVNRELSFEIGHSQSFMNKGVYYADKKS